MLDILTDHLHRAISSKDPGFLHLSEVGRNGGLKMLKQATYVFLGTDLVVGMFVITQVVHLIQGIVTNHMPLSDLLNALVLHKLLVFVY